MALKELCNKPFNGELEEGSHDVTLLNRVYMEHKTDNYKDYMLITLKTSKGEYKRNLFERDMTLMLSHLRRQLGRANETIMPLEFLDALIKNKTPFKIWVTYPVVPTERGMRRMQNIHFIEPMNAGSEEGIATDGDMEVPA